MADGGPGFVDVLHASLGGELLAVTVPGPYGDDRARRRCCVDDGTAYVESAQACGLHLTPDGGAPARGRDHRTASASWSGRAVRGGRHPGRGRSRRAPPPTTAGAGLLAALGATAAQPDALSRGPPAWPTWTSVDLAAARALVDGRRAGGRLRRRQPAARADRRDQRVRPPEGDGRRPAARRSTPRWSGWPTPPTRRPPSAKGAGAAGRSRLRAAPARRHPRPRGRRRRRGRRAGRRGRGAPTS